MNNKTIITQWLALLLVMLTTPLTGATAQSLAVGDFSIKAGETKTVDIVLSSEQEVYGVQTDVALSEGLTLQEAKAYDESMLLGRNVLTSGAVRLIELSLGGKEVEAGPVIALTLTAADDFSGGTVTLKNTKISTQGGNSEQTIAEETATVGLAPSLSVADVAVTAGQTATVPLHLSTPAPVYGVQTDVVLPDGLTVTAASEGVQYNQVGTTVHLVLTNMGGITTGDVVTLTVEAAATAQSGTVKLTNTKVTDALNPLSETALDDAEATVTVEEAQDLKESYIPETVEYIDYEALTKTVYRLSQVNLIKNGTFEYPNPLEGWKTIGYTTEPVATDFTITAEGGADGGAYLTTNGGGVGSEKTLRRSVAVEAGKTYFFSVYTSGQSPEPKNYQYNALFQMTDAVTEDGVLKEFGWAESTTEWSQTEFIFTADEAHPYVGVRMGWNENSSFDEFVLTEATLVSVEDLTATAEDYAALSEAIAEATAAAPVLGFEAGEAAPYNNISQLNMLAAAKYIVEAQVDIAPTVQEMTAALKALQWNINTEEVNAIYDGTFATATHNDAPAGWTMSNNTLGGDLHSRAFNPDDRLAEFNETKSGFFIRFDGTNSNRGSMYYYGNTEGYTMPLKADTYYRVTVDFAGWGSTGKPLRMNVTGPEGFTTVSQEYKISVRADNADNKPQQFDILFKATVDGNYVINFQTPGSDDNKHNVVISNLKLVKASLTSALLAVADGAGYGTFVAPFDVALPEGVKAYTVDGINADNVLELTEVASIAAHRPVVVESAAALSQTVQGVAATEAQTMTAGLLTGTYGEIAAPDGSYILQNHDGKVAFYRVDTGTAQPKVPAYRAYLTLPAGSGEARVLYIGGETTAVKAIGALTTGKAQLYDLSGRQLQTLQKGLNIIKTHDGRTQKVMVK